MEKKKLSMQLSYSITRLISWATWDVQSTQQTLPRTTCPWAALKCQKCVSLKLKIVTALYFNLKLCKLSWCLGHIYTERACIWWVLWQEIHTSFAWLCVSVLCPNSKQTPLASSFNENHEADWWLSEPLNIINALLFCSVLQHFNGTSYVVLHNLIREDSLIVFYHFSFILTKFFSPQTDKL